MNRPKRSLVRPTNGEPEKLYELNQAPKPVPEKADELVAHGTALASNGNRAEAIKLLREAIRLRPDLAKAHHNLGVALSEEREYQQALASLRTALRLEPNYAEAHYNLGNTLGELDRCEEAVISFKAAIRRKPDYIDALNNLGLALTRLGRPEEAIVYLRQAVRLKPDVPEGHNNLGLAYAERGDFATAEACYEQALRLNPSYVDAHTNLGSAFKERGRLDEAMASYELALALDPESVTTHWNRSLAWLQMGNYEHGWREYEWRWQRKETRAKPFAQPHWDGTPFPGRSILVHLEQGMGDSIQFIRYMPMVKERGGTVVVAAPPNLTSLLASCPGIDQVVSEQEEPFLEDFQVPLLSLPALLGTTVTTIPANVPYLSANPDFIKRWEERLSSVPGLKVGVAWQGNPRHKWDRHRSFPLPLMEPLARAQGIALVSLQKDIGSEQVALLKDRFAVIDFSSDLADFTDTAALIQCLDLVICCDTAVAHLAGALGVRVWVALSTIVDWRWLLNRDDSPWYPTMRLFRQERLGEWQRVFERMAGELEREVRSEE